MRPVADLELGELPYAGRKIRCLRTEFVALAPQQKSDLMALIERHGREKV